MAEIVIAAISALIALGAVVVSYVAHRHQLERARVLDDRESRLAAREERVEQREREEERQGERTQASLIDVRVVMSASSLHEGWVTPTSGTRRCRRG